MKSVYFLILTALLCITFACNKFKSDHPQAEILDENATDLTAKSIRSYTDSINKQLLQYEKTTSLVYMLGDLSFYVEKYTTGKQTMLLVEHAYNGGISNSLKKYYFRNDSLVMEEVKSELANDDGSIFKDVKTYLRSNTVFKIENRTASSSAAINGLPYIDLTLNKDETSDDSYLDNVKILEDVIKGADKFDMVFESITTYPDSRYIVLKSKIQNSYSASILVKEKDAFIDSLLNDPINFKDQKLNFRWYIKDHEAVYVPN